MALDPNEAFNEAQKVNRPNPNSKFRQQKLKHFKPILTLHNTTIMLGVFGGICLIFAIGSLAAAGSVYEISERYDNKCEGKTDC